jgi:hypothetical protein
MTVGILDSMNDGKMSLRKTINYLSRIRIGQGLDCLII